MKKIAGYFIQGTLYIAPIGITAYMIYLTFIFVDNILNKYLEQLFPFPIPGAGLLAMFILITFLGYIGQTIIAKPVKLLISNIMDRAPLIKTIYTSIKDMINAFVGKDKKFNQPVIVKVNRISNLEKLGFITRHDLSDLGITENKVAVYFPHSYNFSGELFIVPAEDVKPLNIPSSEVMKFIVSGGITNI